MIRENRSRNKLAGYYRKFIDEGIIDPNVHPWVAQSWEESRMQGISPQGGLPFKRVTRENLQLRQERHRKAIDYVASMVAEVREFFRKFRLTLLLLDEENVVIRSFAQPFFLMSSDDTIEGVQLGQEDIGASSIAIAARHRVPFWLYGPEIWVEECQEIDTCSAPVIVGGKRRYILTMNVNAPEAKPQEAVMAMLVNLRRALTDELTNHELIRAQGAILDATPFAVYQVLPGGEVSYTNKLGVSRLAAIDAGKPGEGAKLVNLNDVVLNYHHTPIYKGFDGIPAHNREVTWITEAKTYEDITTVVPIKNKADKNVSSVVVVSMPIEDLRTLVAHAAGYTAKYSLSSMVGNSAGFRTMREKAARVAKNRHHILLQGESGTGKQRMAHGIHRASLRAAGPLITMRCGDTTPELLEQELFGVAVSSEVSHPGRLELALGGTLFLDEIESLPKNIAAKLAENLLRGASQRVNENVYRPIDVRIIAACDSDLKRLTERGLFDRSLYEIVSRSIIRAPPLRSRREDIPALVEHIIKEQAELHQLQPKKLAGDTLKLLESYDWPGNIKQLQHVVEQAFFNTAGSVIEPSDINLMGDIQPDAKWKEDRDIFVRAWQAAGGNISRLANMLNVSRVTLYRYLRKYGLEKN